MKKGTIRVREWTGFDVDIIGTDVCLILGFYKEPKLIPETIETANGQTIEPGHVILRLGGRRTSAGFSTIWFDDENNGADGKGLVYEGKYAGLDGDFWCFSQLKDFKKEKPAHNGYKRMYFAFYAVNLDSKEFMFTNQAGAGRVSETTNVILRREKHYDE